MPAPCLPTVPIAGVAVVRPPRTQRATTSTIPPHSYLAASSSMTASQH